MNKFDDYTRVEDGLPKEDMFCDIVGVRPDGIIALIVDRNLIGKR